MRGKNLSVCMRAVGGNSARQGKEEAETVKIKKNSARHGKKEAETVKIKRNSARHNKEEAETVKIKRNSALPPGHPPLNGRFRFSNCPLQT
ncbi:hypothetical protein [Neobacillus vireti]|uniref:hypothetical protein n=1 Tax=Neobacillus vireti TaxID=220686 RepID=UPI002FFEF441